MERGQVRGRRHATGGSTPVSSRTAKTYARRNRSARRSNRTRIGSEARKRRYASSPTRSNTDARYLCNLNNEYHACRTQLRRPSSRSHSITPRLSAIASKLCYSHKMTDRKEPTYLYTDKQVAEKSELARRFLDTRTRLNANVDKADNFLVKRFYNLDHNTYLDGAVPAKYKELMGLTASAVLRCDDCIDYHIIQSYRLGVSRAEQEEAINVALVVGGSIVIPHLRRAYELLAELYE